MRVGLQAWGSDGDIRPMIALAAALVRAGHSAQVTLTSIDDTPYGALCARLGVECLAVPSRVGAQLEDIASRAGGNSVKLLQLLMGAGHDRFMAEFTAASTNLCANNDVVVGHFMMWQLKACAQRVGVPHVGFVPWPGMVPSTTQAPPGVPDVPGLRGVAWQAVKFAVNRLLGGRVQQAFVGQPAPPDALDALLSDRLNLLAASPSLWPAARDWTGRHVVCGDFQLPGSSEPWAASDDLRDFMNNETVFLSLGSSEQVAPTRTRQLLVDSARASGLRCLIQLKSEQRDVGLRDGDLYFLPRVPHAELFKRCAAVLHHGGAGTVHTAARAGLPSVVLPFVAEQADWGRRLHAAGAGLRPLSFWSATPKNVAKQLQHAARDASLRAGSQSLAARLATEDGTLEAVRLIAGVVGR